MERKETELATMKEDKSTPGITIRSVEGDLDIYLDVSCPPHALSCEQNCSLDLDNDAGTMLKPTRNSCISDLGIKERKELLFGGGGKTHSDLDKENNNKNDSSTPHRSSAGETEKFGLLPVIEVENAKKEQEKCVKNNSNGNQREASNGNQAEVPRGSASQETSGEVGTEESEMAEDPRPSVGEMIRLFSNKPKGRSIRPPPKPTSLKKDTVKAASPAKTGTPVGRDKPVTSSKRDYANLRTNSPARQADKKDKVTRSDKGMKSQVSQPASKGGLRTKNRLEVETKGEASTTKSVNSTKESFIVKKRPLSTTPKQSAVMSANRSTDKTPTNNASRDCDTDLPRNAHGVVSVNNSSDSPIDSKEVSKGSDVLDEQEDLERQCSQMFEVFPNVTGMSHEVGIPTEGKSERHSVNNKSKTSPSPEQIFNTSPGLSRRAMGSPLSKRRNFIAAHLKPDKFMSKMTSIYNETYSQQKEGSGKRASLDKLGDLVESASSVAPSDNVAVSIGGDNKHSPEQLSERTQRISTKTEGCVLRNSSSVIKQQKVTWNIDSTFSSENRQSAPMHSYTDKGTASGLTDEGLMDDGDGDRPVNNLPTFLREEHDYSLLGVCQDRERLRAGSISVPEMATISEEMESDGTPSPENMIRLPVPTENADSNQDKIGFQAADELQPEFQLGESCPSPDLGMLSPHGNYSRLNLDPYSEDDITRLKAETTRLKLDTRRQSYQTWKETYIEKPYLWRHRIAHQVVNKNLHDDWSPERIGRIDEAISWIKSELTAMRNLDQELARTLVTLRHDIHHVKLQRSVAGHQEIIADAMEAEAEKREEPADLIVDPADQIDPVLKQFGVTRMNISSRRFSVF